MFIYNTKLSASFVFLCLLLIADTALISLSLAEVFIFKTGSTLLNMDQDGSALELFQYVKEVSIALLFLHLGISYRVGIFFSFSLLFAYLFIDDAFLFHERGGEWIAANIELGVPYLRPIDVGGLLFMVIMGSVIFLPIFTTYLFSKKAGTKSITHEVVALFGVLVFFGVFIDALHVFREATWWLYVMMTVIEEYGESVSMTLLATYTFTLWRLYPKEMIFYSDRILKRLQEISKS